MKSSLLLAAYAALVRADLNALPGGPAILGFERLSSDSTEAGHLMLPPNGRSGHVSRDILNFGNGVGANVANVPVFDAFPVPDAPNVAQDVSVFDGVSVPNAPNVAQDVPATNGITVPDANVAQDVPVFDGIPGNVPGYVPVPENSPVPNAPNVAQEVPVSNGPPVPDAPNVAQEGPVTNGIPVPDAPNNAQDIPAFDGIPGNVPENVPVPEKFPVPENVPVPEIAPVAEPVPVFDNGVPVPDAPNVAQDGPVTNGIPVPDAPNNAQDIPAFDGIPGNVPENVPVPEKFPVPENVPVPEIAPVAEPVPVFDNGVPVPETASESAVEAFNADIGAPLEAPEAPGAPADGVSEIQNPTDTVTGTGGTVISVTVPHSPFDYPTPAASPFPAPDVAPPGVLSANSIVPALPDSSPFDFMGSGVPPIPVEYGLPVAESPVNSRTTWPASSYGSKSSISESSSIFESNVTPISVSESFDHVSEPATSQRAEFVTPSIFNSTVAAVSSVSDSSVPFLNSVSSSVLPLSVDSPVLSISLNSVASNYSASAMSTVTSSSVTFISVTSSTSVPLGSVPVNSAHVSPIRVSSNPVISTSKSSRLSSYTLLLNTISSIPVSKYPNLISPVSMSAAAKSTYLVNESLGSIKASSISSATSAVGSTFESSNSVSSPVNASQIAFASNFTNQTIIFVPEQNGTYIVYVLCDCKARVVCENCTTCAGGESIAVEAGKSYPLKIQSDGKDLVLGATTPSGEKINHTNPQFQIAPKSLFQGEGDTAGVKIDEESVKEPEPAKSVSESGKEEARSKNGEKRPESKDGGKKAESESFPSGAGISTDVLQTVMSTKTLHASHTLASEAPAAQTLVNEGTAGITVTSFAQAVAVAFLFFL